MGVKLIIMKYILELPVTDVIIFVEFLALPKSLHTVVYHN